MRRLVAAAMVLAAGAAIAAEPPAAGKNLGGVTGGKFQQARQILDTKCLACHNRKRIEEALQKRADMERIVRNMEVKGVRITAKEREVLNHFWHKNPFKTKEETK